MATWTHVFCEAGNGFPGVGEEVIYAADGDVILLKVVAISSIHTAQWQANYVYVECESADRDWDDLDEADADSLYEDPHHVDLDRAESEED